MQAVGRAHQNRPGINAEALAEFTTRPPEAALSGIETTGHAGHDGGRKGGLHPHLRQSLGIDAGAIPPGLP